MRKTKIVCTIGPATDSDDVMRGLMEAGMNVARFNFSHGTYEDHQARLEQVRRVSGELGLPIATMLDTKGPEIRLGNFVNGSEMLEAGDTFTLTTRDVPCTKEVGSITFKNLPNDVRPGNRVLINDGVIEMICREVRGDDIVCEVIHGGEVKNHKGINVPGVTLSMPFLSEADMNDLEFGAKQGFDFIAASFVRSAADVNYMRKFTRSLGWNDVRIIAKIENKDGVENIDEIIEAADGIMVARGDLGVEIPAVKVPGIQHRMIRSCRLQGKTVIIATQMLDSMIKNPRPTRAEVSDVANAVFDYASCVMLSGETASGKYPVEALRTMREIVEEAESTIDYWRDFQERNDRFSYDTVNQAISHSCCHTAFDLKAQAIITATQSGYSAKMISRFRPAREIVAVTPIPRVFRQVWLVWGVHPLLSEPVESTEAMLALCRTLAQREGLVRKGDAVVIAAGSPIGTPGSTNLIQAGIIE